MLSRDCMRSVVAFIPFVCDIRCARYSLPFFPYSLVLSARNIVLGECLVCLSVITTSMQYHMFQGLAQWVHIVTMFAH